jgi:hypothetical protein
MYAKVFFENRHVITDPKASNDGTTSEVVATNPDLGFIVITKKEESPALLGTWHKKLGFVIYDPTRFEPTDSIMLRKTVFIHHDPRPRIVYEYVAGKKYLCTQFLNPWREWAFNPAIQLSAKMHIRRARPKIVLPEPSPEFPRREAEAWLKIAKEVLPGNCMQKLMRKIPIDSNYKPYPLQIASLPIQIAQGIGSWNPPIPRPSYPPPPSVYSLPEKELSEVQEELPRFE